MNPGPTMLRKNSRLFRSILWSDVSMA